MVLGGYELEELGGTRVLDRLGGDVRDANEAAFQTVGEHILAD